MVLCGSGEEEVSGRHVLQEGHAGGPHARPEEQQGKARDEGCDREKT